MSVTVAARAALVSRDTVTRWLEADVAFAELVDQARARFQRAKLAKMNESTDWRAA